MYAVAEWHPNAEPASMERVYQEFRRRFPDARDDFFQARTIVMVEMLVRAIEAAGTGDATGSRAGIVRDELCCHAGQSAR